MLGCHGCGVCGGCVMGGVFVVDVCKTILMFSLGRPSFRKTQSNLDFSKQGGAGGLGDLPIQIFYMVIQNPDFWGREGSRTVQI